MAARAGTPRSIGVGSDPAGQGRTEEVRFARALDGTHLAFAAGGSGQPMVVLGGIPSSLDLDAEHPLNGPSLALLRRIGTCVRYDERGFGISDRDVGGFSLATRVADLEAVVNAAGMDRIILFAACTSGPVAIAYAARHPERVSHLVLVATFASGTASAGTAQMPALTAMGDLIHSSWGGSARMRRMLSVGLWPGMNEEGLSWLDDHQPLMSDPRDTARAFLAAYQVDVSSLLERVAVPTLVIHAQDDPVAAYAEGRRIAARIPGARLQSLESGGHVLPCVERLMRISGEVIEAFLRDDSSLPEVPSRSHMADLSMRESEVLDLAARGWSNLDIAEALVISSRTVERHLSNIYLKLGISGATARVAAVTARLHAA